MDALELYRVKVAFSKSVVEKLGVRASFAGPMEELLSKGEGAFVQYARKVRSVLQRFSGAAEVAKTRFAQEIT